MGDAAAFRPTAGEVPDVTAGHTAEGTGVLKHIWRTRWFPSVHIWRHKVSAHLEPAHLESLPRLLFHSQSCAEAAERCTSDPLSLSSIIWALHIPPNLPGVRWAMHYSSVPWSQAQRK